MSIGRGSLLQDKHGYTYRVREVEAGVAICVRRSPGGHECVVGLPLRDLNHMTNITPPRKR